VKQDPISNYMGIAVERVECIFASSVGAETSGRFPTTGYDDGRVKA